MLFEKIEKSTWPRREYFDHYFSHVPCTYSMTVRLDVTKIRQAGLKFYPTMLHAITTIVNRHEEFRTAFNEKGELGIYSEMIACYTIFHKDSQTFSNLWTAYEPELHTFCAAYEQDLKQWGTNKAFNAKPNLPENNFPVSMIPWTVFEGFNLNLPKGQNYLLPIFTMGKYYPENEKILLPLSVQVHHAVCDGFHLCRFINELQSLLDQYPTLKDDSVG
ncbi:type A chloramphenicol O-acetyltransferase [uncultured Ruthenibacterium sp.]|uniref:type A chloramphenicol O-acetyltransferase n=1 Tax=uncultured Ruthenibacterium sp. TaxID=1905347 RepID=UPI00349EE8BA